MNHFALREMACRDGTPYPLRWAESRWPALREALNFIRSAHGGPIRIASGYRSPAYNKRVGGVPKSQHVQGRAADLVPAKGTAAALHDLILRLYRDGHIPQLGGLGLYKGFVHVDTRAGRLRRWSGSK